MKSHSILIVLILLTVSINSFAQTIEVGTVITDAVHNIYSNDFQYLEARNGCYRLGYLKSQLELLDDNAEFKRRPARNLNRSLRKLRLGIKECENGVLPRTITGLILKLLFPQSRTGKSANRSIDRLLKTQRFNRYVDHFNYDNNDLIVSSTDKLQSALDESMIELNRCMLIGEATADAYYISQSIADEDLAKKIEDSIQNLNDSCGTTMGERRYNRRINRLIELLERI